MVLRLINPFSDNLNAHSQVGGIIHNQSDNLNLSPLDAKPALGHPWL